MSVEDVDDMEEVQVRDLLKTLIEKLELAEDEGVFGADSWQGFLDIEV